MLGFKRFITFDAVPLTIAYCNQSTSWPQSNRGEDLHQCTGKINQYEPSRGAQRRLRVTKPSLPGRRRFKVFLCVLGFGFSPTGNA